MLFLTAFGIALGIIAAERDSLTGGIIFASLWGVFFLLITVIAILGSSNVRITEDYIASVLFGHVWKSASWVEVKNVRVLSIADFPSGKRIKRYYIERSSVAGFSLSKLSSISFSENIQGIDELRKAVNTKVKQYGIEVIASENAEAGSSGI
jgi:hypothetical protein